MPVYNFTATQIVYNFTATIDNPAELVLTDDPTSVNVTNVITTVTVINTVQPITVDSGGGAGQDYNQSLNTTDNVAFATVTTPVIYGAASQPVSFPTGISAANVGTVFGTALDLGTINFSTVTNQLSLIFAFLPLNFGGVYTPSFVGLNLGPI